MTDAPEDYRVGPGKPPRHTRWQPGQSGNPKGRPKGRFATLEEFFEAELNKKIPIMENGRRRKISIREAFVKAVLAGALKGNSLDKKILMEYESKRGIKKGGVTLILEG